MHTPKTQLLSLLLAGLCVFYSFYLGIQPSALLVPLINIYHISQHHTHKLISAYFYSFVPMLLLAGLLLDAFGARRMLALGLLISIVSSFVFMSFPTNHIVTLSRLMLGIGTAIVFIGSLKLIATRTSTRHFAFYTGLFAATGLCGAIISTLLLNYYPSHLDWTINKLITYGVGLLLYAVSVICINDRPLPLTLSKLSQGFYKVFLNPQLWLTSIIACLMFLPAKAFVELWDMSFFKFAYHYTSIDSTLAVSMSLLGFVVGCPLQGWIADKLKLRQIPLTVSVILGSIILSLILYGPPLVPVATYILLLFFGFVSSAALLCLTIAREHGPASMPATSIAFTATFIAVGSLLAQPLTNLLLNTNLYASPYDPIDSNAAAAFRFAMMFLPLGLILAALCSFMVIESYSYNSDRKQDEINTTI